MRTRTLRAVAGLALALGLAALGALGGGADASTVEAASVTDPVTMPVVEPTVDLSTRPWANPAREAPVPTTAPEPAPVPEPEPEAAPPPPPAPAGSLEAIIERHFGPAAGEAKAIARCESHMDPNAVSQTNDHGLFQINYTHRRDFEAVTGAPWSSIYDPELNTIYAKYLYDRSGWSPWTCSH